jgi:hypothetical protein
MKMPAMGSRDMRALLLGLAILVPSLGWIWGVRPLRTALAETHDRIAAEREALSREQSAVLEAGQSPARQKFADSSLKATDARIFSGPNDVAAGAELVTYLGETAKRTRVWLASAATRNAPATAAGRSSTPATPESMAGLRPLRVELRAESDFQGILEFLDALERGGKVVTVERLDIARALRAGDEDRETLSVSATVVGYAMARTP